jgi:4-amino-4-deoxy-L-arabinose transferase-like glycosyltransferase
MQHSAPFDTWLARWFRPLLCLGVLLNLSGLGGTLADTDATQYATVARTMAESGNFVELVSEGRDWLDKPHLPFWLTALSFRLFGVGTVAYKLPALLFWALALLYTYRYAQHLYSRTVARLAVLLLLPAYHLVLSNNDVRAEPYLTGLIIGSLYHLVRAHERRFSAHLVWGALLAAGAVMTKGIFVLTAPGAGLALHWALHRQWREFIHPRWWVALLLVGVFILPELYCLHQQFDLHPEKVVFGQTGVSGLRFFFWDSQVGRFFNTGPIRARGEPFFFLHTSLWAFLPWSLLLYASVLFTLVSGRVRAMGQREFFTSGAAAGLFLLFSLSGFQLPHYTNILVPFFSILVASWLVALEGEGARRAIWRVQLGVCGVLVLLALGLLWAFRPPHALVGAAWVVLLAAAALRLFPDGGVAHAVGRSFGVALAFSSTLNLFFFPALLTYQAGSEAARVVNQQPALRVGMYETNAYSFEFYTRARVERWDLTALKEAASAGPVHFYLPEEAAQGVREAGLAVRPLGVFGHFRISKPRWAFVHHATRSSVLRPMLLAEVRLAEPSAPALTAQPTE